jgi:hypothetical protein
VSAMHNKALLGLVTALLLADATLAQRSAEFSTTVQEFISVDAPVIALTHVRVIDGTGSPPLENQTVIIANGTIRSIVDSASQTTDRVTGNAKVLDRAGYTVIPGIVGMHDHLFYLAGLGRPVDWSYARLYLAMGSRRFARLARPLLHMWTSVSRNR